MTLTAPLPEEGIFTTKYSIGRPNVLSVLYPQGFK